MTISAFSDELAQVRTKKKEFLSQIERIVPWKEWLAMIQPCYYKGERGKLYPDKPLPHITPHVFRHTFCTNMANAGMDIKTLQYVMGHSDVGVTLNVYTHASYDRAAEQMAKIIDFKGTVTPEKQRKSG